MDLIWKENRKFEVKFCAWTDGRPMYELLCYLFFTKKSILEKDLVKILFFAMVGNDDRTESWLERQE